MNLKSLNGGYLNDSDIVLLSQANIRTTEQLVAHADLEALSRKSSVELDKLKQAKKFILGSHCPLPVEGNIALSKHLKRSFSISFGCPSIDDLVSNGISSHEITEICGPTSSGKTQLCLNLVANMLKAHPNFKCLYIDSSKNFCPKRLTMLLNSHLDIDPGNTLDKWLDSVRVVECQNIFHLLNIVSQVTKCDPSAKVSVSLEPPPNPEGVTESSLKQSDLWSAKLLVIDNLTCLFNQFRPYDQFDSGFYLNYLISYLRYLKSSLDMAVVITTNNNLFYSSSSVSNSYSVFNYEGWKSVPSLIVQLNKFTMADQEPADQSDSDQSSKNVVHLFELIKLNRSSRADKRYCLFRITDDGLVEHSRSVQ